MNETYIKIFMKSEADRPEYNSDQVLVCKLKSGTVGEYPNSTIRCDWDKVEWYFFPVSN
jgi:hypothetical protein